jgi:hypothetical protein
MYVCHILSFVEFPYHIAIPKTNVKKCFFQRVFWAWDLMLKNVKSVVIFGPPNNLVDMLQEIGRVG